MSIIVLNTCTHTHVDFADRFECSDHNAKNSSQPLHVKQSQVQMPTLHEPTLYIEVPASVRLDFKTELPIEKPMCEQYSVNQGVLVLRRYNRALTDLNNEEEYRDVDDDLVVFAHYLSYERDVNSQAG